MKKLVQQQNLLISQLEKARASVKEKVPSRKMAALCEKLMEKLKESNSKFAANHEAILNLLTGDDEELNTPYFKNDVHYQFQAIYLDLSAEVKVLLDDCREDTNQNSSQKLASTGTGNDHDEINLPRISVPKFSGRYEDWVSFRDLFKSLIHDRQNIAKVQKMHYLKCSVGGEADNLLKHLTISDANYEIAWAILTDRYDNKQALLNSQFRKLFAIPNASESSSSLKSLLDQTVEAKHSIEAMGLDNLWPLALVHLTAQRLPRDTRQLWEQSVCSKVELPSFEEMKDFVEKRFRALEAVGTQHHKFNNNKSHSSPRNTFTAQATNLNSSCSVCKGNHILRLCSQFQNMDHPAKLALVKQKGLCLNCLRNGHIATNCPSLGRCSKCNGAHHTMLHRIESTNHSANQLSVSHSMHSSNIRQVLLATAMVSVSSPTGNILLRALIDPGSQATLITEYAVQRLGLKRNRSNTRISGIQSNTPSRVNGMVTALINTINYETISMTAYILKKLTNDIPNRAVSWKVREEAKGLRLADPQFDKPGKIDLLIGADLYGKLILGDTLKLQSGPVAQNTKVGWVLIGETNTSIEAADDNLGSFVVEIDDDNSLSAELRRFWEIEEVPVENSTQTEDEVMCERHFVENTVRELDGRFKVRLPFKSVELKNSIGESKHMAQASMAALERKFKRDPDLKREYTQCINDHIASGYMRLIEENATIEKFNYLPHHAVYKNSTSTKVRVVFDASRKTSTGVSLNDTLLTGTALQNNLNEVLLRFRLFRYAFVVDITKMFLQINMHEEDSHFQRIVWRNQPTEPMKDYHLTTVTFGTRPAPFLAMRTLRLLAEEERAKYPLGAESIFTDFYVDDCLSGADDIETALEKRNQVTSLLALGGFELRKWLSNEPALLEGIPPEDIEMNDSLQLKSDEGFKSLGIEWHPIRDYFSFRLELRARDIHTKRTILSDIASLFDPLGWIAPILVNAKILLQALWKHGNCWDGPLPFDIEKTWIQFHNSLHYIEDIRIARWLHTDVKSKLELHGFGDASDDAYGAAVYLVIRDGTCIKSQLVMAKSKVSPIKHMAIARLELCAAQLLAKLMKVVWNAYNFSKVETWLWSDNTTVLSWLKGHPTKWKVFVANRTADIINTVGNTPWRYVPSGENPADLLSRGVHAKDLIDNAKWWNGPPWLLLEKHHWPQAKHIVDTNEELRKIHLQCYTVQYSELDELLSRFSSLTKLLRVTALCFRFKRRALKLPCECKCLTTQELQHALQFWVKHVQEAEFSREIRSLQMGEPIHPKSKIRNLNPSLKMEEGILRVGGRLRNANWSYDETYPIILPKNSKFTELLLNKVHKETLHGQTQLMLATIRKKFWIIDGRNLIRHFIHRCMTCFRVKAATSNQLMGDLPSPRVTVSRPFTHTGVDYCGPFTIRDRTGRGTRSHKGYIAVFICLAVKAIHIELVNDMSTAAFLAALRRFIGRRGLCSHIYSDCGTNFVGAEKELRAVANNNSSLRDQLVSDGISWHFNPPASPHFGGLWEAGVKSIKSHLKRVLGNVNLTYEEFNTTLIDIEACLNSRPLCPLTDDPMDDVALTPGHFLIGDSLLAPPQDNLCDVKLNHLDRWQLTQRLSQSFWRQWKDDYLRRLQQRPKWLQSMPCPNIGDLCLVKDDKTPSFKWPLGRIVAVHPGADTLVRVVSVRMKGNVFKRPITKIALLPSQNTEAMN